MIPLQHVVNATFLILASVYTLASLAHIALLWRARNDFVVVARSPRLACMCGLFVTVRYMASTSVLLLAPERYVDVNIITFPMTWVAYVSTILVAARLLVIYYPANRTRFGRYTNEKRMVRGCTYAYALTEISWWLTATFVSKTIIAKVVFILICWASVFAIVTALYIGVRLKNVEDLNNMSRDFRLVLGFLILAIAFDTFSIFLLDPHTSIERYITLALFTFSHPPIVWILNIKPARVVLGQVPERVIVMALRRASTSTMRIFVTSELEKVPGHRYVLPSSHARFLSIMEFEPLREAFCTFCNKSLCGESFQFLEAVREFKSESPFEARGQGFGMYRAIVKDHIENGCHSEVNVSSNTKSAILAYKRFDAFSSLNINEKREVFSAAESEIMHLLSDNLLNGFILSKQYREIAYCENTSPA